MSGEAKACPGGWRDGAFNGMSLMIHGIKEVVIKRDRIPSRPHLDITIIDENRHEAKITLFLLPDARVKGAPK